MTSSLGLGDKHSDTLDPRADCPDLVIIEPCVV
jgi:hypothetical protein